MACLSLIAGLSLVATFQQGDSQVTNITKPSISRHQYQNLMQHWPLEKVVFGSFNPNGINTDFRKVKQKINTIDGGGWVKGVSA